MKTGQSKLTKSGQSSVLLTKQIEHWAEIGKMVEDNPDLPYSFIKDAIIATTEAKAGKVTRYVRGKRD